MQQGDFEEIDRYLQQEYGDAVDRMPDPPEIDQMKKDELYDLQPPGAGQVRISLQWIYSKVKLLDDILLHLRFHIHRDKSDKAIKENIL